MAPRAAHQQTAATGGKDAKKSPPVAWITEQAHSTEEAPSTPQEGDGTTSAHVSLHDDGVKGKATAYSNQLPALICYFTKVEAQRAGEH